MTRMIPPALDTDVPGERALYEALRDAPGTDDWVAFHSLDIAPHIARPQGEADFVVIVPALGILTIEVKSHHRIEVRDGQWYFGGRNKPANKSPFDQASEAMHSVRDYLHDRGIRFDGYPTWHAVWLTAIPKTRIPRSVGWMPWSLLDAGDLENAPAAIRRVLDAATAHLVERRNITPHPEWLDGAEVERIVALLEPEFVATMTAKEATKRRRLELEELTREQKSLLDVLAGANRMLVEGPAGSGKTVFAVEAACRAVERGERVGVVVFNRLIEAELRQLCPGADVIRLHRLMERVAGMTTPAEHTQQWFLDELPELALAAAMEQGPIWDTLILDEVQDLARESYLDVLDTLLEGGLKSGSLIACGDFELQQVYLRNSTGQTDADGRELLLQRAPGIVPLQLRMNTRNVPELGAYLERGTGREGVYGGYRRHAADGPVVDEWTYSDADEQQALLGQALRTLLDEPFSVRDIVVLSPYKKRSAALAATTAGTIPQLGADIEDPGKIRWGTIHEFKGMEAPAVVLTDIEADNPFLDSLFYVGASRATDRLIVLRRT